jgi:hypothetical protein
MSASAKRSDHRLARGRRAWWLRAATGAAIVLTTWVAAPRGEVIDRVVATVGTRTVTLSDVRAAVALGLVPAGPGGELGEPVIRAVTDRVLMGLEVERYGGSTPDEAAVTRRIEALTARLGERGLAEAMARYGLDEARLRSVMREELAIEKYVDDRFGGAAQPTADEVREYYLAHPDAFTRDGAVLPFAEAEPSARAGLANERTQALVARWLDGLRRRVPVDIKAAGSQG